MKKLLLIIAALTGPLFASVNGQESTGISKIDMMLVRGEYNKVIDTCSQILITDSLNAEIYFKMGLAYQNNMHDEKSFRCFLQAATIVPANNMYNFMIAKAWYGKEKMDHAKQLLNNLCATDSMNWTYAYYLTSILMQEKDYDGSLKIYRRFYEKDSTDYVILDKIGFALLRKGFYPTAIEFYNRSLALNKENISSIKNLSYLYASSLRVDTALQLLTMGMEIDPADMDLYVRRAALNFSLNYTKRALNDYLKILASGDSSVLYLKRSGIGYSNNLQPKEAVVYLLLANKKDSSDVETTNFLVQNYNKLNDPKNSIFYNRQIIRVLSPVTFRLSLAYVNLAEALKKDGRYKESITAYLKGQEIRGDVNIYMIVANIYDNNLNDIPKAIQYYQRFLDNYKNSRLPFQTNYVESVQKRLDFLKEKQKPVSK